MKFFIVADEFWNDILFFSLSHNNLFTPAINFEEADVVLVAFLDEEEQNSYLESLVTTKLVIAKPTLNTRDGVYFLFYQYYDQSIESLKNQASIVDTIEYVQSNRFGVADVDNEKLQMAALEVRFNLKISGIVSPNGTYSDELVLFSNSGKLCSLSTKNCEYKERWATSIFYNVMIIAYGTEEIRNGNKDIYNKIL